MLQGWICTPRGTLLRAVSWHSTRGCKDKTGEVKQVCEELLSARVKLPVLQALRKRDRCLEADLTSMEDRIRGSLILTQGKTKVVVERLRKQVKGQSRYYLRRQGRPVFRNN